MSREILSKGERSHQYQVQEGAMTATTRIDGSAPSADEAQP